MPFFKIWSLDGRVIQVLDRSHTLPMSFDPSDIEPEHILQSGNKVCVRDVSWHSQEPVMMSVGWESRQRGSTVARHEWKGLSKRAAALEDWVASRAAEQSERAERAARRAARRPVPPHEHADSIMEESEDFAIDSDFYST